MTGRSIAASIPTRHSREPTWQNRGEIQARTKVRAMISTFCYNFSRFCSQAFNKLGVSVMFTVRVLSVNDEGEVWLESEGPAKDWKSEWFTGLVADIQENKTKLSPTDSLGHSDPDTEELRVTRGRVTAFNKALHGLLDPHVEDTRLFLGLPLIANGCQTVPIIELEQPVGSGFGPEIDAAPLLKQLIYVLLREGYQALCRPDAGRYTLDFSTREPDELLREAGKNLMGSVSKSVGSSRDNAQLFKACNDVSALPLEGSGSSGIIVFSGTAEETRPLVVNFENPVPVKQSGWLRKAVELTSQELFLVVKADMLYDLFALGLDDCCPPESFRVHFEREHRWSLRLNKKTWMDVEFGIPRLPRPRFSESTLGTALERAFPDGIAIDEIVRIVKVAVDQGHGTMVVVSNQAKTESERLSRQSTPVKPLALSCNEHILQLTAIDGAIILDTNGLCHAIGAILDGLSTLGGTPARGARYNSAVRYVNSRSLPERALAVVISEDGPVDIKFKKRVRKAEVDNRVAFLIEESKREDFDRLEVAAALNWFNAHRTFLDDYYCNLLNNTILPSFEGKAHFWQIYTRFSPNPDLDEDFFEPVGEPSA